MIFIGVSRKFCWVSFGRRGDEYSSSRRGLTAPGVDNA